MVPNGRSKFKPMGRRTKGWIKGMRVVQLCLRVLEAVAAAGFIVVMGVGYFLGWIMGVTVGSSLAAFWNASIVLTTTTLPILVRCCHPPLPLQHLSP